MNAAPATHRASGFTLLEMLVVLAIAGFLIGMIGPRIAGRIDAVRGNLELQDVLVQLQQLPRRVQLSGRSVELPRDQEAKPLTDGLPILALPEHWRLQAEPAWIIGANGLCSPARLSLRIGAGAETELGRYRVDPATCKLSEDAAP